MSVSIFNLQICLLVCHAVSNVDNNTTHNKEDWKKLIETERVEERESLLEYYEEWNHNN